MELLQIMRFDEKIEKKIVNALKKLLPFEENCLTDEQALKEGSLFKVDTSNVCMIEALTNESKLVLAKFIEKDYKCPYSLPTLEFLGRKDIEIVSRYGADYLKAIIGLLSIEKESVEIKLNNNYPGQFSNKYWRITLSPRVEND